MTVTLLQGDSLSVLKGLDSASVQCAVTSPPYYGLRDYGMDGQIGNEQTPDEYIARLVAVFRELWRVLKDDSTLWLNLGDSYNGSQKGYNGDGTWQDRSGSKQGTNAGALNLKPTKVEGLKPKDLLMIPARVALALQADGWYLRNDIIWHKPNVMPESVTDRCTRSHEYIFLLSKSAKYYCDMDAIKEPFVTPQKEIDRQYTGDKKETAYATNRSYSGGVGFSEGGRNKRDVWTVNTKPYKGAHFAVFPPDLIEPCILAGSRVGDTVLDPFNGSGTTGFVSVKHGRNYIGVELNPAYIELSHKRIEGVQVELA